MTNEISYTPDEVAKILKISRFTVYELIKRGELPAYRIGRKMRIDANDIETYKQKGKGITPTPSFEIKPVQTFLPADESLIICGQDIILDILTRHIQKDLPNIPCFRQYIGSIDGLLALYHNTANVVTCHLWDSDSDDYNTPYIRRFLPGHQTVVINLVYRYEGFYVAIGNPKEISKWQDLTKPNIRFINREKGSGARVLLDEKLRELEIIHNQILGYNQEETSHLAVASTVARGEADVGLGIEKVADQVKGIEFIPLQKERVDLVVRKEDFNKPHFQSLFNILRSNTFRNDVAGMGGYDVSKMGEIMAKI